MPKQHLRHPLLAEIGGAVCKNGRYDGLARFVPYPNPVPAKRAQDQGVKTTKIETVMSKLKIKPLADRVLVEPMEAEQKTAAGIIIPDTAKEKPQQGVVVAVGPGKKDEPMSVKAGDKILYGKYSGSEINIDGTNYLIMRESDIFAIL